MPLVHIKSKRIEYKFKINDKFILLQGDSGIGKTTFYRMVFDMSYSPLSFKNYSDLPIIAVPKDFDYFRFNSILNSIMVIDSSCSLFNREDCLDLLNNSNNYFIIINRALNNTCFDSCKTYTFNYKDGINSLKLIK